MKLDCNISNLSEESASLPLKTGDELIISRGSTAECQEYTCSTLRGAILGVVSAQGVLGNSEPLRAFIKSIRRGNNNLVSALTIRVEVSDKATGTAGRSKHDNVNPHILSDEEGYILQADQYTKLARNMPLKSMLSDSNLQKKLKLLEGSENREGVLEKASLDSNFREFADLVLSILRTS